jgi:hypothetical protein
MQQKSQQLQRLIGVSVNIHVFYNAILITEEG